MNEWRKLGGDLAAKPGCENTECYGEICVEPERCYAEAIELVPYRPLGANERYCPACGADTLQRAPDGTEYFGGHGEADCYRRRLVFALAELQAARAEAEALRKRIEALERERQTGMWLSTDDCNILMHGLRDRGELEGNLIPEALERYQQLVGRIIDVGVGWSGGAEDA